MTELDGRYIRLNANLLPGPISDSDTTAHPFIDIGTYVEGAKLAEAGGFDAVFLSDALAIQPDPRNGWNVALDPFTILPVLAHETEHIGLIATASTTFAAPYALARAVLSIDHISNGRAGWNVITTMNPASAKNFGVAEHPPRAARYERADEFTAVVLALWSSWNQDLDAHWEIDELTYEPINHHGAFFDVAGPLQIPSSRQGLPVIFQAGGSEEGIAVAAKYADGVFTVGLTEAASRSYRERLNSRSRQLRGSEVAVLPGLWVTAGSTETEVRRLIEDAEAQVTRPNVEQVAGRYGLDADELETYLDRPLPQNLLKLDPAALSTWWHQSVGFAQGGIDFAQAEPISLRRWIALGGGVHRHLFGTPEAIANDLIAWVQRGAADGFNLHAFDLERFVEHVVPILRERGVLRREYTGTTLRENLAQSAQPAGAAAS